MITNKALFFCGSILGVQQIVGTGYMLKGIIQGVAQVGLKVIQKLGYQNQIYLGNLRESGKEFTYGFITIIPSLGTQYNMYRLQNSLRSESVSKKTDWATANLQK